MNMVYTIHFVATSFKKKSIEINHTHFLVWPFWKCQRRACANDCAAAL